MVVSVLAVTAAVHVHLHVLSCSSMGGCWVSCRTCCRAVAAGCWLRWGNCSLATSR
jgi:hypothetical protein